MRYFFVAPLVSADHGDAQHFHLRRLDQQRQRLHVAAAGAGTIFVDNDFAPRLAPGERACQQQRNREPRHGSRLALSSERQLESELHQTRIVHRVIDHGELRSIEVRAGSVACQERRIADG